MTALIVVDHPEEWPLTFAAAEVISADSYLRDERLAGMRQARVYNLCDSYQYQTAGYYVSLLAAARGHRTMPGVATIQDVKSRSLLRADDELEEIVERSLHTIKGKRFELSIYFGCNLAEAARRLEPRPVQPVPDAADAGDVREVLDDEPVAAAQHHADPRRRHSEGPRGVPAQGHREPLRAARPGGASRPQRPLRARPRDPDERGRALAAVEPRGAEALRARRALERLRRRVPEPRRLRPHRRVRRAVHPRDDGRQPSHVPVREPGACRRARRRRRPGIDHPLRQQGLPGRAREAARPRDPADDGRRQQHRRPTRSSASSACRAC